MTKQPSQDGFAHIGLVLLGLLVIVAISSTGWYIVSKNNGAALLPASDQSSITNKESVNQSDDQEKTEPYGSLKDGYLTIKEWGVKMKADSDLEDVSYNYLKKDNIGTERIELNSELQAKMGCPVGTHAVWSIYRSTPDELSFNAADNGTTTLEDSSYVADIVKEPGGKIKLMQGHYFIYNYPQDACSEDPVISARGSAVDDKYKQLFDSLETIQ